GAISAPKLVFRVHGKLTTADPSLLDRISIRAALQEPVHVRDASSRKPETMEHRQSIEPVPIRLFADLELTRADQNQTALEPRRHRPLRGKLGDRRPLFRAGESERISGRTLVSRKSEDGRIDIDILIVIHGALLSISLVKALRIQPTLEDRA